MGSGETKLLWQLSEDEDPDQLLYPDPQPYAHAASTDMWSGCDQTSYANFDWAALIAPTLEEPEMSSMSTSSAHSAPSSALGSPRSIHGQHAPGQDWTFPRASPRIESAGLYRPHHEHSLSTQYMDDIFPFGGTNKPHGFVDPTLIHAAEFRHALTTPYENAFTSTSTYPTSPPLASPSQVRIRSMSPPFPPSTNPLYPAYPVPVDHDRRQSMLSFHSGHSSTYSDGDPKEKQRCPHPECGKVYKDLKAHMLTHQTERPEKCPITTCEYHVKGFARKYDKNRHTLTHYKGNMVCGFCPGSGSAAEKSFNRADVFKRHLTAVHGVEQTPPNSRKNRHASSVPAGAGKKPGSDYAPDATGKCSTCSQTFSNAQDFYEHLDDCVLRIVQQEDPAEAVNARRLAEVENDAEVHNTLERNDLVTAEDEEESDPGYGEVEWEMPVIKTSSPPTKKSKGKLGNPTHGVQKFRGSAKTTNQNKGRKINIEFPRSWGYDDDQMVFKKRVASVFDGQRRLAKDESMLSTHHEVRLPLSDGKSYVTDLDVLTLQRAEAFLNATDEEKGPWAEDMDQSF